MYKLEDALTGYVDRLEEQRWPHLDRAVLAVLQDTAHAIAVSKGWWETERPMSEALLKITCEVAEAVQALEQGNPPDKHLPRYDAFTVELADIVIRVLDLAGAMGLPLSDAIMDKMEFNRR